MERGLSLDGTWKGILDHFEVVTQPNTVVIVQAQSSKSSVAYLSPQVQIRLEIPKHAFHPLCKLQQPKHPSRRATRKQGSMVQSRAGRGL